MNFVNFTTILIYRQNIPITPKVSLCLFALKSPSSPAPGTTDFFSHYR